MKKKFLYLLLLTFMLSLSIPSQGYGMDNRSHSPVIENWTSDMDTSDSDNEMPDLESITARYEEFLYEFDDLFLKPLLQKLSAFYKKDIKFYTEKDFKQYTKANQVIDFCKMQDYKSQNKYFVILPLRKKTFKTLKSEVLELLNDIQSRFENCKDFALDERSFVSVEKKSSEEERLLLSNAKKVIVKLDNLVMNTNLVYTDKNGNIHGFKKCKKGVNQIHNCIFAVAKLKNQMDNLREIIRN